MIEFKGYLTGEAKEVFFKRTIKLYQIIFLCSACLILPTVIMFAIRIQSWLILAGCAFIILFIPTLIYIGTKTDKNRDKYVPKLIRIADGILLTASDDSTESRFLKDVKEVCDYGEYYVLVFPFGKPSQNFICQKNLLTQGTLEEFEALFEGKIVKK